MDFSAYDAEMYGSRDAERDRSRAIWQEEYNRAYRIMLHAYMVARAEGLSQAEAFHRALTWLQSLDAVDPTVPPRECGPSA